MLISYFELLHDEHYFCCVKSLEPYIVSLLRNHDCVVIPGFGGLVANVCPAYYHAGRNLYLPPYKNFAFNRNLEHNDGLLCNTIAQKAECSYAEAYEMVRTEVRTILRDLRMGKTVELSGLGHFVQDSTGNISFAPEITINFLLDSFGLQGVMLPEIAQSEKTIAAQDEIKNLRSKNTSPQRKLAPMHYINWAAAAAAVVFMFFISTPVSENSRLDRAVIGYYPEFIRVAPAEETSKAAVVKSVVTTHEIFRTEVQPKAEKATTQNDNHTLNSFTIKPQVSGLYYVIIGSFPSKSIASSQFASFSSKPLSNLELIDCGSRFRVSCGSFANRADAEKLLEQVKSKNTELADAWVYKATK